MELLRREVDRWVSALVQQHTRTLSDFSMTDRDVCRQHPELARGLLSILPALHISSGASSLVGILSCTNDGFAKS